MAQAEINIGTVGHVDHGKTTLTYALTGKMTDTHSEEVKRGITIKLGYADADVLKCRKCGRYTTKKERCLKCGSQDSEFARKISFVDSPGHETLMATVIAASSIMDGALFVIAVNEECPQPQTLEHLMILEAAGIKKIIVVQNKVDLVTRDQALKHYKQIKDFLKGTPYENAAIIPVAANAGINVDAILEAIQEAVPTPKRESGEKSRMYIVRSFDINKPGSEISKLVGGVLGGAVVSGSLKKGDKVIISPGLLRPKGKGKEIYEEITTTITSLYAGSESIDEAKPGGLIAVGTMLDPSLTKGDSLVGCVVGPEGSLPKPRNEMMLEISPMKRMLEGFPPSFAPNEPLVLGIGTMTTVGFVDSVKKKIVKLILKKPVTAEDGAMVAVMRRANNRWRLYGTGKIVTSQ